jgi:hypothetical protein
LRRLHGLTAGGGGRIVGEVGVVLTEVYEVTRGGWWEVQGEGIVVEQGTRMAKRVEMMAL